MPHTWYREQALKADACPSSTEFGRSRQLIVWLSVKAPSAVRTDEASGAASRGLPTTIPSKSSGNLWLAIAASRPPFEQPAR